MLVDDHTVVREGVRALLEASGAFDVIAEAATGEAAVELVQQYRPDILLMDLGLPGMNGLEALQRIHAMHPDLPVVVLTMHATDDYFLRALEAGALGYILKDSASTDLIAGLRAVRAGDAYMSPVMQKRLVNYYLRQFATGQDGREELTKLTKREQGIVELIAEGRTTLEIAELLHISANTVQTHRAHVMQKLNLHGRAQLVRHALRMAGDDSSG